MRFNKTLARHLISLSALLVLLVPLSAHATEVNYSNTYSSVEEALGYPNTTAYGETFIAPSENYLQAWSFYFEQGQAGNFEVVVAPWNGSAAVGPALYTSAPIYYNGSNEAAGISNTNIQLITGDQYIAFASVAGVSNPIPSSSLFTSAGSGGLGGQFYFINSNGANPLTSTSPWIACGTGTGTGCNNLQFSATFSSVSTNGSASSAAVPSPGSLLLLLLSMGALVVLQRRSLAPRPIELEHS